VSGRLRPTGLSPWGFSCGEGASPGESGPGISAAPNSGDMSIVEQRGAARASSQTIETVRRGIQWQHGQPIGKTGPRSHVSPVVVDAGPGLRRGPGDEPPPPGRWLSWKRRQAASSHLIIRFQRDATSCKAAGSGVSLLPLLALSRHVKAMGGPNASAAFERQHL
jgi:hypothetical protein